MNNQETALFLWKLEILRIIGELLDTNNKTKWKDFIKNYE